MWALIYNSRFQISNWFLFFWMVFNGTSTQIGQFLYLVYRCMAKETLLWTTETGISSRFHVDMSTRKPSSTIWPRLNRPCKQKAIQYSIFTVSVTYGLVSYGWPFLFSYAFTITCVVLYGQQSIVAGLPVGRLLESAYSVVSTNERAPMNWTMRASYRTVTEVR